MRAAVHALAAAAIIAAGCGSAAGGGSSGLRGTVYRGPTTPVCRVGEPCSAPAGGVTLVFSYRGRSVRTTTNAQGRFRVALAPGTWKLTVAGARFGVRPSELRVFAGRFRTVKVLVDTGIR